MTSPSLLPPHLDPDGLVPDAVAGRGAHDPDVARIVYAVLLEHAITHRHATVIRCLDHDVHDDIARALHAANR